MTNEEAVKWLSSIKDKYILGGDEEFDRCRCEAIDLAIKQLENQDNNDSIPVSWLESYARLKCMDYVHGIVLDLIKEWRKCEAQNGGKWE